jgi:hypothetical protein
MRNASRVRLFKLRVLSAVAMALLAAAVMAPEARAQIFVTNQFTASVGEYGLDGKVINASLTPTGLCGIVVRGQDIFVSDGGSICEYTTSGGVVSEPLVAGGVASGLQDPNGVALSGTDLFVTDTGTNRLDEYDITGANVAVPLVSFIGVGAQGIAVSGSDLFVGNQTGVGEYTTSGAVVNASLISGLTLTGGIAISGSALFVVTGGGGVSEYTLGATPGTITSSNPLMSGLDNASGVAVYGSDLYVTSLDKIGEYDMSGNLLMTISDYNNPLGIVVVPEPATGSIAVVAGLALLARRPRRRVG